MSKDEDGADPERQVPEALNALVAKYGRAVRRFVRKRWRDSPPESHEDIAQEVYLKLLRYPPAKLAKSPEGYLFKIAINVMNDRAKKSVRERRIFESEDAGTYADVAADASMEHEQHTAAEEEYALMAKLLPSLYFAALVLHKRDGYSQAEIAKMIGKSSETVRKYISVALARWSTERKHIATRRSIK